MLLEKLKADQFLDKRVQVWQMHRVRHDWATELNRTELKGTLTSWCGISGFLYPFPLRPASVFFFWLSRWARLSGIQTKAFIFTQQILQQVILHRLLMSFILSCCRRERLPTPVFLPGEFHGQRSLAGYNPWGVIESDMTEQLTYTYTFI